MKKKECRSARAHSARNRNRNRAVRQGCAVPLPNTGSHSTETADGKPPVGNMLRAKSEALGTGADVSWSAGLHSGVCAAASRVSSGGAFPLYMCARPGRVRLRRASGARPSADRPCAAGAAMSDGADADDQHGCVATRTAPPDEAAVWSSL
ncbi:hypothetical protein NDU88_002403 [Pleurodeles waltl]|uniref:Uncharacterized protein n=1 Tax=Pleurodeles waltl TaxID=8319 RepID=A0AAV7VET1_PLEWA|nr:hypothetical protein NDU88_002403 [Pleurodeles waltl]